MVGIVLVIPLLQQELQGRDIQVVLDPLHIFLVEVGEQVRQVIMVKVRVVRVVMVETEK